MARVVEMIEHLTCDWHSQKESNNGLPQSNTPGITLPPITTFSGKIKLIELCDDCLNGIKFMDLMDIAAFDGRDPKDDRLKTINVPKTDTAEYFKCKYCEAKPDGYPTQRGRTQHTVRVHPESKEAQAARERSARKTSKAPQENEEILVRTVSKTDFNTGKLMTTAGVEV